MRQGCVPSPRLFCSVLEWALNKWRMRVRPEGIDLEHGGEHLLDLRFADDILVFATSSQQAENICLMNLWLHWQTSV